MAYRVSFIGFLRLCLNLSRRSLGLGWSTHLRKGKAFPLCAAAKPLFRSDCTTFAAKPSEAAQFAESIVTRGSLKGASSIHPLTQMNKTPAFANGGDDYATN